MDSALNIYIAGDKYNGSNNDGVIKKFSPDGIEITDSWDKVIDGSGNDGLDDVITDLNDNVYIAGRSASAG